MTDVGGRGAQPEDQARHLYLDRLETHLRMPPEAAWDVLDEVEAHIDDAIAAGIEEGLTPEAAERRALHRLGPPQVLGKDLRRTHQTRRRLLAAAGGGVWQAARGAVRGYLAGSVLSLVILIGGSFGFALLAFLFRGLHVGVSTNEVQSIAFAPLWGAMWLAARELTLAVSGRSLRSVRSIRLPIALLGTLVAATMVAFVPADYTHLGVGLALATPLVFPASVWTADRDIGTWLFGARWPAFRLKLQRRLFIAFVASVLGVLVVSIVQIGVAPPSPGISVISGEDPSLTPQQRWHATGYDAVATTVVDYDSFVVDPGFARAGFAVAHVPDDVYDWDRWRDLRFEVWPSSSPFDPGTATLAGDHPMAVVPIHDPWATTGYAIRVGYPDAAGYLLFLTAVDPATGQRVAFGHPSDGSSMFHGSLIEWFEPR